MVHFTLIAFQDVAVCGSVGKGERQRKQHHVQSKTDQPYRLPSSSALFRLHIPQYRHQRRAAGGQAQRKTQEKPSPSLSPSKSTAILAIWPSMRASQAMQSSCSTTKQQPGTSAQQQMANNEPQANNSHQHLRHATDDRPTTDTRQQTQNNRRQRQTTKG